MSTELKVFKFESGSESNSCRVHIVDGKGWWVAKDVCSSLGLENVSRACERLDDDEKGMSTVHTLGGDQDLVTVTESGLYSLILTSRKPEARAFRRWVTHEVLPAIHHTGSYTHPKARTKPSLSQATSAVRARVLTVSEARLMLGLPPLPHSTPQPEESEAQGHLFEAPTTDEALLETMRSSGTRAVIMDLLHRGEPYTVRGLARRLGCLSSTVLQAERRLEADGIVRRDRSGSERLITLRTREVLQ